MLQPCQWIQDVIRHASSGWQLVYLRNMPKGVVGETGTAYYSTIDAERQRRSQTDHDLKAYQTTKHREPDI